MSKFLFLLCVLVCAFAVLAQTAAAQDVTQGSLFAYGKKGVAKGDCPLKNTSVRTNISGFVARVNVRQEFENTFTEPIEAIYTFPLSQNGAVDDMTMTIGSRTIRAKIMKREEARQIYETAKEEGKAASLLDQERPNIFTQSVANIMPGEKIVVEISYVETLKYEDGAYEFVFPMTVGPRYTPGGVKDAAKIKPTYATERTGHDISLEVNLNAGVPVEEIKSKSHDIQQVNFAPNAAKITLTDQETIPNKDFILRYDVTGGRIADALLTHRDARGGFFTLMLQPPDRFTSVDITPKEIVFVLDTSGSMSGFPIDKAKEAMKMSLEGLNPEDTFNLITFAGDTSVLFPQPVPATRANMERATAFLESREGGGGTEMMKAIKVALDPSDSQSHLRVVCFMTDGYVGDEEQIIAEVQRHPNARVFSFGIGSSVNRYLLDKMAEASEGEVEYVSLTDDGSNAAKRFHERVRTPLLTDISIDWNGMQVSDMYPAKLPDLFSAKPVVVTGRYSKGGSGVIRLKGKVAGQPYSREIAVTFPENEPANDVLATLWARKRIDGLMMKRGGDGVDASKINAAIANIGLEYRLMTDTTSFVAVEDRVVNQNGKPVTIQVPVAVPEGVDPSMSGAISSGDLVGVSARSIAPVMVAPAPSKFAGSGGGSGYGAGYGSGSGSGSSAGGGGGGKSVATVAATPMPSITRLNRTGYYSPPVSSGVLNGAATKLPKPTYPTAGRAVNASGVVTIQVIIDESGKVISATAISGHPLLRAAAEQAASRAEFVPTRLSGKPVKATGVIAYNFINPNSALSNVTSGVGSMDAGSPDKPIPAELSPAMVREALLKEKMHSWIYGLATRFRTSVYDLTKYEAMFVKDGRATVRIELWMDDADSIKKLEMLGFEILSKDGGIVIIGRIAVEKLATLAEIEAVKFVFPKI